MKDPRHFQLLFLSSALAYGLFFLGFDQSALKVAVILSSSLVFHYGLNALFSEEKSPKSALITGLSLSLLLRSQSLGILALAPGISLSSKYLLRIQGKHFINPALASLLLIAFLGQGWISPGQWGQGFILALFIGSLGGLVTFKAWRLDISLAFLLGYAGLWMLRTLWLGDPWSIFLHKLFSGSLILFTFFMLSDPRSTPNARLSRLLFGMIVALLTFGFQTFFYTSYAPFYALGVTGLLTPLFDRLKTAQPFNWNLLRSSP